MGIGPVGNLNRFAYLQHSAGLPDPNEKRKAGELVRQGILAPMYVSSTMRSRTLTRV